jgi:hypothetical protein
VKISKEAKAHVEARFSIYLNTAQNILDIQLKDAYRDVSFKSQAHEKRTQLRIGYIEGLIKIKVDLYIQAYKSERQIINQTDHDEIIAEFESLVQSHTNIGTEYTNVFSGLTPEQAEFYENKLITGYRKALYLAKKDLDLAMTEMRVKEKERIRRILLLAVYKKSNGSERKAVSLLDLASEQGITELEAIDYLNYLESQRWVKDKGYPGMVSITHEGVLEVEKYYGLQEKDSRSKLDSEALTSLIDKLASRPIINVQGDYVTDTYQNYGQTGAQGHNAYAHDMTFNQIVNHFEKSIDLPALAKQLTELREEMAHKQDSSLEVAVAKGEAAKAEMAAYAGDTSKVVEHLKAGGQVLLDIFKETGKELLTAAIKASMGMQ